VYPTYFKLNPKGHISIKINFFLRDPNEDLSKHKFKFEALIIDQENSQKEIKEIYYNYDTNKDIKGKVFSLSRSVKLIIGKNKNNNSVSNPIKPNNFQANNNSQNNNNLLNVI